jgi:hypothetical protein
VARDPLDRPGPDRRPERPALAEALRMAALPARPPTDADRPPVTTFPKTRAALTALRLDRDDWRRVKAARRPM